MTDEKLKEPGPYSRMIISAVAGMCNAVTTSMNLHDYKAVHEMKRVCDDLFRQAEAAMAMDEAKRNVQ